MAEPGDLLYVPPGWRHDGVALERSLTYSIGFRAPRGAELGAAFLDWLHERGLPDAQYRDPRLKPAGAPARIPREMAAFAERALARISWSRRDVQAFLGEYLTEKILPQNPFETAIAPIAGAPRPKEPASL